MRKLVYIAIFAALLLVACKGENGNGAKSEVNKGRTCNSINIAVMPSVDCLPYFIAQERGLFADAGLDVSLVPFNAQMDVDTALVGGSVDGAFTDLVRTEKLISQGAKLHYLTATEAQWQLITNKQSRLTALTQFGDKMIAMTRFSATDFLTEKVLKDVNTTADVFRVQINDVNVRMQMLRNNEIDAVWFAEPLASQAIAEGHKLILTENLTEEKLGVLAFRQDFASQSANVSKLDLLRKVYSQACDSINQKGFSAYADVLEKYCNVGKTAVPKMQKHVFVHAEAPTEDNINKAKSFLK